MWTHLLRIRFETFEELDEQICEDMENKEIWEIMKYKENKEILHNILKNQEILISKEKSHPWTYLR